MERCLYDPASGFYGSGRGRSGGSRGDFITSPEVGPLFGAVLAAAVDHWWTEAGRPSRISVVDLGAGPGALLTAMELAAPPCAEAWTLTAVDRTAGQQTPDLNGAIVIANELLDNVPFDVGIRSHDGDRRLDVLGGGGPSPSPVWTPVDHVVGVEVPLDQPFPVLDRAADLVRELLGARPTRIVAFDYGMPTTAALAARGGWLRTYRRHERGDDPFVEPGEWDITTDVAVDQLPPPFRVSTQADFLRSHRIEDLVEEGRAHWEAHAAAPNLEAMRMRSRVREAEALLDPNGLGGFLCLEWTQENQPVGVR